MTHATRWMRMTGIALLALVCVSCFSPWTGEETGDGNSGGVTVSIRAAQSRAAITDPPTDVNIGQIEHTVLLTRVVSHEDETVIEELPSHIIPAGRTSTTITGLVRGGFYSIKVYGTWYGKDYSESTEWRVVEVTGPNTPAGTIEMDVYDETVFPYLGYIPITSADDLAKIGSSDWPDYGLHKNYLLTKGISLSEYTPWTPIGDVMDGGDPFTGTFDGNGKTISGLKIDGPDGVVLYAGLFGYIQGGTVTNLTLVEPLITSGTYGAYSTGGIAGYVEGGEISNCVIEGGSIKGPRYVGGVAGSVNVYTPGSDATVAYCRSSAEVKGDEFIGGVVGDNSGTVKYCSATGNVEAWNNTVGGVAGTNSGIIEYCSAMGNVFTNNVAGGVVGDNYSDEAMVSDCYYAGPSVKLVGSSAAVGGVAGTNVGTVKNCYATGVLQGHDYITGISIGGVVGRSFRSFGGIGVENCVALVTDIMLAQDFGRVTALLENATLQNNYGRTDMMKNGTYDATTWANKDLADLDGADVTLTQAKTASWWQTNLPQWDPAVWSFENGRLPKLVWELDTAP